MKSKLIKTIVPPVVGLLLVIILLQVRQTLYDRLYPDEDPVFIIQPLFEPDFYLILYLPGLVIAVLFQYFITLRVWGKYKVRQRISNLSLTQLVLISCFLFGLILRFYFWSGFSPISMLIFYILFMTGLAIVYWTANLLLVKLLDKNQQIELFDSLAK